MTSAASPPKKIDIYDVANRLWDTADELRANSHLKAADYSIPVLGLIFRSRDLATTVGVATIVFVVDI